MARCGPDYMARAERDPRRGRPAGHGGHPRPLLLRPGRAPARRGRRAFAPSTATVDWVLDQGYRNVLIEINNECNVRYDHAILQPARVHELITRAKEITRSGRRLLVSTSYGGNTLPGAERAGGLRLRAAARQRRDEPGPHRRDGPPDPRQLPALHAQARSSSTKTTTTTSTSRGTTSSPPPASTRRGASSTSAARARASTRATRACRSTGASRPPASAGSSRSCRR